MSSLGFRIETKIEENGPPTGNPVGIKLRANDVTLLPELIQVSKIFEEKMRNIEGTKNINNSSPDSPGQVLFRVNEVVAANLGISPTTIYRELATLSNGAFAGTIRTNDNDIDIRVLYDRFQNEVLPYELLNSSINTPSGPIRLNQVVSYEITNAVQNIAREDGNIIISVGADLLDGYQA